MFEHRDLERANMTSTKKADELEVMLSMTEDISLEENTMDDNILSGNETIRNVRMVSFSEEEELKSQVEELNAQLKGKEKLIAELRKQMKSLEEKNKRCRCKRKQGRVESQEKSSDQGRSKFSKRMSRERSFQKRNKSLSLIPEEKTSIKPRIKWKPKQTV